MKHLLRFLLTCLLIAAPIKAHVGSPDIYADAKAGPYELFITVRPPAVIPGVAQLEIRSDLPGITRMTAAPVGVRGDASKFAPIADQLVPSREDGEFFTGAIWLMRTGSFEARITVDGPQGRGIVNVPIPALAKSTKQMQPALGIFLFALMSLLVAGLVAITGAAVRDAPLEPGIQANARLKRKGRIVMACVFVFVVLIVWLGNSWWKSQARAYDNYIYKPLMMDAKLQDGHTLVLRLSDPGWLRFRKVDDFIPDHNHLMHLYLLQEPGLRLVYHLHPEVVKPGVFSLDLPSIPPGHYNLYADVVHEDGFPETLTASVDLPAITGRALAGDDAEGEGEPARKEFLLPDGYKMVFENGDSTWRAKQAQLFRFKLIDPKGAAPSDMALYMGMMGHAAFVKTDGAVFAHIHPNGTMSMAAYMMGNGPNSMPDMTGTNMPGTTMTLPNTVSFPFGFPSPGEYRIFVQMKHGQQVETGIFRAEVAPVSVQ